MDGFDIQEPERLRQGNVFTVGDLPEINKTIGVQPRACEGSRVPFLSNGCPARDGRQQGNTEFQLLERELPHHRTPFCCIAVASNFSNTVRLVEKAYELLQKNTTTEA